MISFVAGLFLLSGGTLMYEVVLTRMLSVISWYYLAFVSVSTAMFGMTAGALLVQLDKRRFSEEQIPQRLVQFTLAMAVSMPLALILMLAVPIEVSYALETVFSFLLFNAIIATPFFFSGVVVCMCLTRSPFPIGKVYFVDLLGAAAGCLGAVAMLNVIDAPSAMLAIGALLFVATIAFATYAGERRQRRRFVAYALILIVSTALNALSLHGVQLIWSKGAIDLRENIFTEVWNPISRLRVYKPTLTAPLMWGPSPRMPPATVEDMRLDIDNDAATPIYRYQGNLNDFGFLRYDVTSLAYSLRKGGTAAIIGVGGGRDVLTAASSGFRRIVGVEVNGAIADLVMRRLRWFTDLANLPGFELHRDEGRSYMTRTSEKFDVVQASMVDTFASASAGAMTLTENSLYTVDAWQVFYRHLRPGGLLTFSRWSTGRNIVETLRMFSLGWATLLEEGVPNPGDQIALVNCGQVATLLLSNRPFSVRDLGQIHDTAEDMGFAVAYLSGFSATPELRQVAAAHSLTELNHLWYLGALDYSPVFDSSPFFFSFARLGQLGALPYLLAGEEVAAGSVRALAFLVCFMVASLLLLIAAVVVPLTRWARFPGRFDRTLAGAIAYFIAIGLGFMLVEISMMQQLSLLLGHPIYSLVFVLAVLILFSGLGSLASERLGLISNLVSRMPAVLASLAVACYAAGALAVVHRFAPADFWVRALVCMMLIAPLGFLMGFCFPVGLRWMRELGRDDALPWMWALNGGASVLGSFGAVLLSMQFSIAATSFLGALFYLLGAMMLPWKSSATARFIAYDDSSATIAPAADS